jgi:hypothetical protein
MSRIITIALVLFALVAVAAPLRAADVPAPLLDAYLKIGTTLAGDKTDGVPAAAKDIAAEAKKLGAPGAATLAAAEKVAAAADLKATRLAFGDLSDAVIALAGNGPTASGGAKRAYCPMVKKYWLQKGEKIENPYYGSQMLRCGEFK